VPTAPLPPVLIVPGLGNSGPEHWQTLWLQAHPEYVRVEQRDWDRPEREEWIAALDRRIAACARPPVLVAHSLSCSLVAHWIARHGGTRLHGVLLVAPADIESAGHTPPEVRNFAPMPLVRCHCPGIVVASSDDPYVDFRRARFFADAWGCRLVEIGRAGHINADAGYGDWPQGHLLLEDLLSLGGAGRAA
jgi:uncharacterized protein